MDPTPTKKPTPTISTSTPKPALSRTEPGPPSPLICYKLHPAARLPTRSTDGSLGYDVYATIFKPNSSYPLKLMLPSHTVRPCPTGLVVKPPPGYFVSVWSRSGLASKGIIVANAPGLVDLDYSGELMILLYNTTQVTQYIETAMRIAQLVLLPLPALPPVIEQPLDHLEHPHSRGPAGFGSTGV